MTFEVNPSKDMEMMGRMLGNKQIMKHAMSRLMCLGVAVFLWVYFNGGKEQSTTFISPVMFYLHLLNVTVFIMMLLHEFEIT